MPTATETSISRLNYVKNWKEQMKEACSLALQHSHDRKAKDLSNNHTKRPYLTTLELSGRVLKSDSYLPQKFALFPSLKAL